MFDEQPVDQVQSTHPELDALECFLASHPDVLKGLMDVPFGELLNKFSHLGFDKELLQKEILSTGLFTYSIWLKPLGTTSSDDLWKLSALQYCDQSPDIGAILVASIIKSIKVSDDQLEIISRAGGKTSLTLPEKLEIAGGAVLLGYVAPRLFRTWQVSKEYGVYTDGNIADRKAYVEQIKAAEQYNKANNFWTNVEGKELRSNTFFNDKTLGFKDFGKGTKLTLVEFNSWRDRTFYEIEHSIIGYAAKGIGLIFKSEAKDVLSEDADSVENTLRTVSDETESQRPFLVDTYNRKKEDLELSPFQQLERYGTILSNEPFQADRLFTQPEQVYGEFMNSTLDRGAGSSFVSDSESKLLADSEDELGSLDEEGYVKLRVQSFDANIDQPVLLDVAKIEEKELEKIVDQTIDAFVQDSLSDASKFASVAETEFVETAHQVFTEEVEAFEDALVMDAKASVKSAINAVDDVAEDL